MLWTTLSSWLKGLRTSRIDDEVESICRGLLLELQRVSVLGFILAVRADLFMPLIFPSFVVSAWFALQCTLVVVYQRHSSGGVKGSDGVVSAYGLLVPHPS